MSPSACAEGTCTSNNRVQRPGRTNSEQPGPCLSFAFVQRSFSAEDGLYTPEPCSAGQVLAGGSDVPLEEAAVLLPSASPGATLGLSSCYGLLLWTSGFSCESCT